MYAKDNKENWKVNNCTTGYAREDVSFHGFAGILMLKIRSCFLFVIPVQTDISVIALSHF